MIVLCTKDYRDPNGKLKNRKSHAYKSVWDDKTKTYLITSEYPWTIGIRITDETFKKYFRIFVP
jgi:hypothetical protein